MAEKRDYYEVLGVSKTANEQEIKKAYRKCAMQFHPDRNPGDSVAEDKFREATEAYEVLIDSNKRSMYDQYGHAGLDGQSMFGNRAYSDFGDIFSGFEDLFSGLFGGGFGSARSRSGPARGAHLQYNMLITLGEAAEGADKEILIPRKETCEDCEGSGCAPGSSPVTCQRCGGHGQVRYSQGFFTISRTCDRCGGAGTYIDSPCLKCKGRGKVEKKKKLKVKIPAGVDRGSQIRIKGQGESGDRGGPPGDLFILIDVKPHSIFERHGDDLVCEVPISFTKAALGANIEVPSLSGVEKVKIPHGTQTGAIFTIKNKGIPNLRGYGRGDLHVRAVVEVPTKLNKKQKELLQEFAELSGEETGPLSKSFFDKMKDMFT